MPRVVKLLLWTAFFVALPLTITWAQSTRQNCIYDYLKYCSAHSPSSKAGQDCMRRHGPQLSDRCITALVADGIITLDEVKDVADDAGLEIEVQPDGSLKKRRKLIAFFDPPVPVRNPRRVEQELAAMPPIPVRNPRRLEPQVVEAPVTIPEPKEIKPVPPPAPIETQPVSPPSEPEKPKVVPPTPEPAPEPPKEETPKKKSVLERAVEIIKKGYEKDYIRKPDHDRVKPKVRDVEEKPKPRVRHVERPKPEKRKAAATVRKHKVRRNKVKQLYKKRRQSVRAQDRRRNKRLHGFDSDYEITPGGYGSNFQYTERFRIQK